MSRSWPWRPALIALVTVGLAAAEAQDGWNPFREKDEAARRAKPSGRSDAAPPLAPMGGVWPPPATSQPARADTPSGFGAAYPANEPPPTYAQPLPGPVAQPSREAANSSKIERFELEPALAADGSGLPQDAWRGMDVKATEDALSGLALPPRSAALHGLWARLISAPIDPPAGGATPAHFEAIRLEALYRSGLIAAMSARLEGAAPDDVIMSAFAIRRDLVLGRRTDACQTAKALTASARSLPVALVGELHLLRGYCAAAAGDAGGAGIAADLARDEGIDAPVALATLDALAGNGKGGLSVPKQVRVLDYRLLELLGPIDTAQILDKAEPPLVAALALQVTAEPRARVAAGEAAALLSAITAEQLRTIYQSAPDDAGEPSLRRAGLVRAIAAEPLRGRKLQLMRAALDDARKAGLLKPMADVLAPLLAGLPPSPELRGDAETAVEILLLAGDPRRARAFVAAAGAWHWLPLLDIAEAAPSESQREQNLGSLDEFVRRGRLPAALLHRLATVLDATDVNVPIPLWEAASRTQQPSNGYLPETGVLAQLQDAAKQKQVARTTLLAMRALGPAAADGAHIIALGDTIRALRRAGLDADARRLGVEALIAQWPHGNAS